MEKINGGLTQKDIMKNNINNECQKVLDKYFEGREYDKEKAILWKNYTLDEISNYLEKNFVGYGFAIFIVIIKRGNIRTKKTDMSRPDTDDFIFLNYESKTMYCEIRISFFKIYNTKSNYLENIEEDLLIKMNNYLTQRLEGKIYSYDLARRNVEEINKDLMDYLGKRKITPIPTSSHLCYIIEKPMDFIFNYKIINLKYCPLMSSYSNDSLYSQLLLLIFNN